MAEPLETKTRDVTLFRQPGIGRQLAGPPRPPRRITVTRMSPLRSRQMAQDMRNRLSRLANSVTGRVQQQVKDKINEFQSIVQRLSGRASLSARDRQRLTGSEGKLADIPGVASNLGDQAEKLNDFIDNKVNEFQASITDSSVAGAIQKAEDLNRSIDKTINDFRDVARIAITRAERTEAPRETEPTPTIPIPFQGSVPPPTTTRTEPIEPALIGEPPKFGTAMEGLVPGLPKQTIIVGVDPSGKPIHKEITFEEFTKLRPIPPDIAFKKDIAQSNRLRTAILETQETLKSLGTPETEAEIKAFNRQVRKHNRLLETLTGVEAKFLPPEKQFVVVPIKAGDLPRPPQPIGLPPGVGVRPVEVETTGLGGVKEFIRGKQAGDLTSLQSVGLGITGGVVSVAGLVKQTVTAPIQTTRLAGAGLLMAGRNILSGRGFPIAGQTLRQRPIQTLTRIVTELPLLRGVGMAGRVVGEKAIALATRTGLTGRFLPVSVDVFGRETITRIPSPARAGLGAEVDIGLIPSGLKPELSRIPIGKILEEVAAGKIKIPFRTKPSLPKTKGLQKEIFEIAKELDEPIGGSFSQQALLKKGFARKFKDLDIDAFNQKRFIQVVEQRLGNRVKIRLAMRGPKKDIPVYKISDARTGKEIADVVPYARAEQGFARLFSTIDVEGVRLVDPRARLASKAEIVAIGTPGQRGIGKALIDVELLTGKKFGLTVDPRIVGAFVLPTKIQKLFERAAGPRVTAAKGLVPRVPGKPIEVTPDLPLFVTPAGPKVLREGERLLGFVRPSRLILKTKEATLRDIALQADIGFTPRRQIVVLGKKGIPTPTSELEEMFLQTTLKRLAKPGVTLIGGKRVPIIFVEEEGAKEAIKAAKELAKKVSKETKLSLRKSLTGELTTEELGNLEAKIFRETGRRVNLRSLGVRSKVISRSTLGVSTLSVLSRVSGISGISGVSGISGISGVSGVSAVSPISQISRVSPLSQISAVSGVSGISGVSGVSAVSGISGISGISPISPVSPPPVGPSLTSAERRRLKQVAGRARAYKLFVKRGGKFRQRGKLMTRGEAKRRGARIARDTLAASFKIRATEKFVKRRNVPFTPSPETFRTYKIKGQQRIPLEDEWIQRRGKRLRARTEVGEIQRARQQSILGLGNIQGGFRF